MRRAAVLVLALCACGLGTAGCGGGKQAAKRPAPAGRNVDPVPTEGVGDAINRVEGAITASGCEAVKGLLHSSYGEVSDVACRAVKTQIDGFRDPVGKRYGTGAVIDFTTFTGRHRAIALVLDLRIAETVGDEYITTLTGTIIACISLPRKKKGLNQQIVRKPPHLE